MLTLSNPCAGPDGRAAHQPYLLPVQAGAFTDLFHRYQPRIYQLCLHYLDQPTDAEDATMEIFERLSRYLATGYPVLNFSAWLHHVARNHCLRRRELRIRRRRAFLQFHKAPAWYSRPDDSMRREEKKLDLLYAGIRQLNRKQRDCLLRFYFEQQPYKEIAGQLGLSAGAVKSHIQNGKRNLRKFMLAGGNWAADC